MFALSIFLGSLAFTCFFIWYLASDQPSSRRMTGLGTILASVITCGVALLEPITLGPDLKGGTVFLLLIQGNPSAGQLQQASDVIRKRLDALGNKEVTIVTEGTDRLKIEVPGLEAGNVEDTKKTLSQVAKLEFRIAPDANLNAELLAKEAANGGHLPFPEAANYKILPYLRTEKDGKVTHMRIAVNLQVGMTGHHVVDAYRTFGTEGGNNVAFSLDSDGTEIFKQLNLNNLGRNLAIILDDEVRNVANFNPDPSHAITQGRGEIENMGSEAECDELASVLKNPLDNPIKILSTNTVGSALGASSIREGLNSGVLALVLVVGFMVIYYRLSGTIAVLALAVNLVLLFGLMDQLHFTLTLPGIAGIVLTIGMAVDANVLIYERIRDELALKKPARIAIDLGFERAFSAIFDSNITTLIPALVLASLGTGPLRGFAITLVLGIVANLFAALVVSRNAFDWILSKSDKPNLSMMQFIKSPKYDFLSYRYMGLVLSAMVLLGGAIAIGVRGDSLLGVDFRGGDAVTITYADKQAVPTVDDLHAALTKGGFKDVLVQYSTNTANLFLQTEENRGLNAVAVLQNAFPGSDFKTAGIDQIGAQVGGEMKIRALTALLLGLLGILIFAGCRFEWSYAISAAVGQLHDVLIALSIMAMMDSQLTLPLVGAFLTIAGYSINDKIVVFDRIREGVRIKEKGTFYEAINRSLNLTLARTILTGGTCLLATLALLLFGGPVIHDFSLAMFIGIMSGIYSSHFISPGLAWWLEREASDKALMEPPKGPPSASGKKALA